jgi:hypothetical protein
MTKNGGGIPVVQSVNYISGLEDGDSVIWDKIEGREKASMQENTGFGSFITPVVGGRLIISGDYGLITSVISKIDAAVGMLKVTTQNSIYIIRKRI